MAMQDGARRLAAVDEAAAYLGAFPGQTVADAVALNPGLALLDAEPEADAHALETLADWHLRFSPLVAVDAPDGLFLDIAGCAHLWGGEQGLARAVIERLGAQGVPARIGIADSFGAAWALARFAGKGVAIAPRKQRGERHDVERSAGAFSMLRDLPVAALRLDPSTVGKLQRLGLKTVGQLAAFPRTPLRKRFGPELALRLAQAFDDVDEPLVFRHPPEAWGERRVFAEPISTPEDMARSVADLAQTLCARLGDCGLGARRFEAVFHRVDGATARREVTAALPAREPKRLAVLFAPKIETLDPGFGVEVVTLLADAVEPLRAAQTDLVDAASDARDQDLAPLVDRLKNSLGEHRVWRAVPLQSHVPERAVGKLEPLAAERGEGWDPDKPRPIRLLARPEPIEAVAPLPDDPPALIRWRGRVHRIRRAEGPERIAAEWWRSPWEEVKDKTGVDRIRDYYRVEDEAGGRFWVFRSGLYGGERPTRWWLHGVFA